MFYVISLRHVQIMTLSLTETLFRDSIFKVSLRGTKCRSNPVARDCFASLAITLIRTAMTFYYSVFLAIVLNIHRYTPKRKKAPGAMVIITQLFQAPGIILYPNIVPKPIGSPVAALKPSI